MKIIFIILTIVGLIRAEIDIYTNLKVEQNIKALYKDIDITDEEKEYIEESEEKNINEINKILMKEAMKNIINTKSTNDKNIIQFELDKDGKINNVKLILKSDKKELNKITKSTIKKAENKLMLPKKKITLRYIFRYDIKNKNTKRIYQHNENDYNWLYERIKNNNKQIYQIIKRGTTHFKYSGKEEIREFETSRDGFINMSQEPMGCAKRVTILTERGQGIAEAAGLLFSRINKEAPKGKYRILVQTKQDCNINLHYE